MGVESGGNELLRWVEGDRCAPGSKELHDWPDHNETARNEQKHGQPQAPPGRVEMEEGKPLIYPKGGEDEERRQAKEEQRGYGRGQNSTPSASGGYSIDKLGISVPDAHSCFYPFSIASISPASRLPILGIASSPSIPRVA